MLFVSHSACVDLSIIYFWLYLLKWKTQPIYASCISKHTVTYCNDCNCYDCYVLYVRSVVVFFFLNQVNSMQFWVQTQPIRWRHSWNLLWSLNWLGMALGLLPRIFHSSYTLGSHPKDLQQNNEPAWWLVSQGTQRLYTKIVDQSVFHFTCG